MCECPISSALSGLLTAGEGTPLKVAVTLTTSDEVLALRSQVASLQAALAELRASYNRVEFWYSCEVRLNLQLQDIMAAAGVPFPDRLRTRGVVPGDGERS